MFFYVTVSILSIAALFWLAVAVLAVRNFFEARKKKRSTSRPTVPKIPTLCRFCHQELESHEAYKRACGKCRASLRAKDENALSSLREAAPPLFEDTASAPYRPDSRFIRMFTPPEHGFGDDKPGETHTTSFREFMQYPTLHRERFIAALFSDLSSPAELSEETLSEDVVRITLANPERSYRAHRPRSLGMGGVGRMDCYITAEAGKRSKNTVYKVRVVHFVFARADDLRIHKSSHTSIEDAKSEARKYLRRRYREVPLEHMGVAASLLDDSPEDTVSIEDAVSDLQRAGAAIVGPHKAMWLAEVAIDWDGSFHKLVGYVKDCESKKQVLLMLSMMPSWGLSQRKLVEAVKSLEPHEPESEVVSVV